ncbi:T-cell surface glycoprotein CD1b-3-like isoform X3 [Prinia subflava]|uniref:T-cell surface glycoprotein CD1b-3-like isoform X3 n=1 Tax=Prinia subflava TaxID=208062 RepID=UPI002FE0E46D
MTLLTIKFPQHSQGNSGCPSSLHVGTSEPSPKPQCQPHWLPGPLAPAELPRQSQPEETTAATSPNSLFLLLLHPLLHTWGLPAGTMQSPCCCLLSLLLYLVLLSGTWADLEDPFVFQCMGGCILYPNRTTQAFAYVGYNGQDFLSFDTKNATWTLSQDTIFSQHIKAFLQNYTAMKDMVKMIFSDTCVNEMKMVLQYGRAALERQELPVATVFARTPSLGQLLLVCHVTGFYPRPISVAWLRDGQEVPPGPALNTSPILPNADLTYQLRSALAVAPRDGHSYVCRVRHHSLGTHSLLIPWGNSEVVLITGLVAGLLAAVAMAAVVVLWVWRQRSLPWSIQLSSSHFRNHQPKEESKSRNSILSKGA